MSEDGIALLSTAHPRPTGWRRPLSFCRVLIARFRMWLGVNLETVVVDITTPPTSEKE